VTVNMTVQTGFDYWSVAYLEAYFPQSISTNYVASPETSSGTGGFAVPPYSFSVANGTSFIIVVQSVEEGGAGGTYQLSLSQNFCAATPTPTATVAPNP
jgi:hypothetical protein